jgi:hypothetical protein
MVKQIIGVFLKLIGKVIVAVLVIGLFLEVASPVKKLSNSLILSNVFHKIDELSPEEHLFAFNIWPSLMFMSLVEYYSCECRNLSDLFVVDSKTSFFLILSSCQVNQQSELWKHFSLFITERSIIMRLEVSAVGAKTVESENVVYVVEVSGNIFKFRALILLRILDDFLKLLLNSLIQDLCQFKTGENHSFASSWKIVEGQSVKIHFMELHQDVLRIVDIELEIIFFFLQAINSEIQPFTSIKLGPEKTLVHLKNVFERVVWKLWWVNIGLEVCFIVGELEKFFRILTFLFSFF